MADYLTPEKRSEHMGRVRSSDTKPEMIVRRLLHGMGYRYRLHWKGLPGRPDIVFPRRKKVIFVHGCFWHRCPTCKKGSSTPASNSEFWRAKLAANVARDHCALHILVELGWEPIVVWECETRDVERMRIQLQQELER